MPCLANATLVQDDSGEQLLSITRECDGTLVHLCSVSGVKEISIQVITRENGRIAEVLKRGSPIATLWRGTGAPDYKVYAGYAVIVEDGSSNTPLLCSAVDGVSPVQAS